MQAKDSWLISVLRTDAPRILKMKVHPRQPFKEVMHDIVNDAEAYRQIYGKKKNKKGGHK